MGLFSADEYKGSNSSKTHLPQALFTKHNRFVSQRQFNNILGIIVLAW